MNLAPAFDGLGESVSAARRAGDEDPDKAIIADRLKLLGNSGYMKMVTNVDRHRDVKYCIDISRSAHQRSSTTNGFDNRMSPPKTRTK